jgi:hypothetical protein
MSLSTDGGERTFIVAAEAATKTALTEGLDTGEAAVMTAAQYAPTGNEALAANAIKATAAGIVKALATMPIRLPIYAVNDLPSPGDYIAALVYCWNGANGQPILAYSSGLYWLRSDTGNPVSMT